MSLYLVKKENISLVYTGKIYRRDYDNLHLQMELNLIRDIEELIDLEKKITLMEELKSIKMKENKELGDFIKALKLKRLLKYA